MQAFPFNIVMDVAFSEVVNPQAIARFHIESHIPYLKNAVFITDFKANFLT